MDGISMMSRAAIVLILAAGISLCCQTAFAEEEATVVSVEQADASMANEPDMAAASGVPDAAAQGDVAAAGKDVKKPEKKGKQADASIPSANPDDANKHSAWRKRDANKAISDLPNIRRSMIQQGN